MLLRFASVCSPLPRWWQITSKQLVSYHRFWPLITEGFPASEVTYSASSSTAPLRPTLLSNVTSLFSVSSYYWPPYYPVENGEVFLRNAQQLWKTVRKQKNIICSRKDLEALLWSCCPDLNSLLQSQDPASYEGLWFYFFMHLSWPHFVKCQVDLFIHNPPQCSGWQPGVVFGWRG